MSDRPITVLATVTLVGSDGEPISEPVDVTLVRVGDVWQNPDPVHHDVMIRRGVVSYCSVALSGEAAPRVVPLDRAQAIGEGNTHSLDNMRVPVNYRPGFDPANPRTWTMEEHAVAALARPSA